MYEEVYVKVKPPLLSLSQESVWGMMKKGCLWFWFFPRSYSTE